MRRVILVLSGALVFCCLPSYSAVNNPQVQEIFSLHELDALVRTTNKKMIFIDFYQDSCPPCTLFFPLYEYWACLFDQEIVFVKVDVGRPETKDLHKKYKISGLPTLIVLDSQGQEIDKVVGMEAIKKLKVEDFLAQVQESTRAKVSSK